MASARVPRGRRATCSFYLPAQCALFVLCGLLLSSVVPWHFSSVFLFREDIQSASYASDGVRHLDKVARHGHYPLGKKEADGVDNGFAKLRAGTIPVAELGSFVCRSRSVRRLLYLHVL